MDEPKDLRQAVLDSARFLGYSSMKEKQIEATCAFVEGHDTFVSLPTGYGKSLVYAVLPLVFDKIRGKNIDLLHSLYYSIDHFIEGTSGSIVLCISPLTSLMMDQREKYAPKGISSEFVGGDQTDPIVIKKILEGAVQLVFITPESIIENPLYRNMLLSQPYIDRLVALVVDEAHCVKLWGDKFRKAFGEIGDLRSLVSSSVKVMALTATATAETFSIVTKQLSMWKPILVALSPCRVNIMYKVHPKVSVQEFSDSLCAELAEKRTGFPKTIVYIRKFRDCETIYGHLKKTLGASITEPPAYPYHISKFRLVDMFTSVLTIDKKEQVLKLFTEPEGNLRLLVATTSFGMGIDCPDIRRIIHWGVPTTVEEYAQETGRAGRDGKLAVAILYEGVGEKYADAKMKAYLTNHKTCRRVVLFQDFIMFSEKDVNDHCACKCCDICACKCTCDE